MKQKDKTNEQLDFLAKQAQELDMGYETKPGFVERRMKQMNAINDKTWDDIYEEYSNEQYPPFGGPFTNALSFIDWLKQNYIAPERK